MPPRGQVDFKALSDLAKLDMVRVLEPAPETETEHIVRAIEYLRETWNLTEPKPKSGEKK